MKILILLSVLLVGQLAAAQTVVWDSTTLVRVSAPMAGYCGYARMIQLADRSLLTVYEARGNIVCVHSGDLGRTWSSPDTVAVREEGINMAVPDLLRLNDCSLPMKDLIRRVMSRRSRCCDPMTMGIAGLFVLRQSVSGPASGTGCRCRCC